MSAPSSAGTQVPRRRMRLCGPGLLARLCRPLGQQQGQGLTEYLGLALIVATALSVGLATLPAEPLPSQARNGYRAAVCKFHPDPHCADREAVPSANGEHEGDGNGGEDDGGNRLASLWENAKKAAGGVAAFFEGVGGALKEAGIAVLWGIYHALGTVVGFVLGALDDLLGIISIFQDPQAFVEGLQWLKEHPKEALSAVWDSIKAPVVKDWKRGQYGLAIGRALWEVAGILFSVAKVGKLGKLGKAGKTGKPDKRRPHEPEKKKKKSATCPRSWRPGGSGTVHPLVTGSGTVHPYTSKCLSPEAAAKVDKKIDKALRAPEGSPKRLEGEVGDHVREKTVDFDRKVGPGGTIGQVDVETNKTLIEVTQQSNGKLEQTTRLRNNRSINPKEKPVILYAPNYNPDATRAIEDAGGYVAHNEKELDALLKKFGEE